MSSLCPRCGATIRWRRHVSKSGRVTNRRVTIQGNPHNCPRANTVAVLLDQGKRPYHEIAKRHTEASARRVENNIKKGLTADAINDDR